MASLLSNERYAMYYQRVALLYKRPEIRASLEVILSVFTVTILIFAAIRPTLVNITSLQKKIDDQTAVDKKASNKMVQLLNAQKQLSTFANSLYLFDDAVPDGYSYSDDAKRIEFLARENNLTINTVIYTGETLSGNQNLKMDWAARIAKPSANGIINDKVTFTVNGKPQNVINFLNAVENMDRLAVLNSVSLTKSIGQTEAENSLKADGQVTFYFYSTAQ
jgi:hypothetical protein